MGFMGCSFCRKARDMILDILDEWDNVACYNCGDAGHAIKDCPRTPKGRDMKELVGEGVEGDWRCVTCSNVNFSWRTKCNKCNTKPPPGVGGKQMSGEWNKGGKGGKAGKGGKGGGKGGGRSVRAAMSALTDAEVAVVVEAREAILNSVYVC